jgi:hypothetical protein
MRRIYGKMLLARAIYELAVFREAKPYKNADKESKRSLFAEDTLRESNVGGPVIPPTCHIARHRKELR